MVGRPEQACAFARGGAHTSGEKPRSVVGQFARAWHGRDARRAPWHSMVPAFARVAEHSPAKQQPQKNGSNLDRALDDGWRAAMRLRELRKPWNCRSLARRAEQAARE